MSKDFRARFKDNYGNKWNKLFDLLKSRLNTDQLDDKVYVYLNNLIDGTNDWRKREEHENGKITREGKTDFIITSKEEAIRFFEIDTSKERIIKSTYNQWAGNTQVKVVTEPVDTSVEFTLKMLEEQLAANKPKKYKNNYTKGQGIGVVSITDLHLGADIKDLLNTQDFNIDIVLEVLDRAVARINSYNYNEVHVAMLGDLLESVTGLNHPLVMLEMDTRNFIGARGIINASKILVEYFLAKINNLTNVYMVSGNHDRVTPDKKHDVSGYAAELVADRISLMMPDVYLKYHPYLLKPVIDGVQYILHHGDKMFAKKDFAVWVTEHIRHDVFNLGIQGHWHTTDVVKYSKSKLEKFDKTSVITRDSLNFRKITAPSIFTGNTYSETGGYSSNSGLLITSRFKGSKAPDTFFHYF